MGALPFCLGLPTRLCRDVLFENGYMPAGFAKQIQKLMRKHVEGTVYSERMKHVKYVFLLLRFFVFLKAKKKSLTGWHACDT